MLQRAAARACLLRGDGNGFRRRVGVRRRCERRCGHWKARRTRRRGGKEEEKRMRRGEKICPAPPIYLRGGDRGCAIYCARSRKRRGVMAPRSWPRFPLRLNCRTIGHTVGHKEVTASCGTMDREEPEATRAARSDRNQVLARARSPRRPA